MLRKSKPCLIVTEWITNGCFLKDTGKETKGKQKLWAKHNAGQVRKDNVTPSM